MLKRNSTGFSRGRSRYRGVTRALTALDTRSPASTIYQQVPTVELCLAGHHQQAKFEARIGRVAGSRYLYLGTFSSEQEAAEA